MTSTYDEDLKQWKHQCRNCKEFYPSSLEFPKQCPRCKVKYPQGEPSCSTKE